MTREQIEQQAKEYAPEPTPYNLGISVGNDIKRASFIAGAESRNEEIEELEKRLSDVSHKYSEALGLDIPKLKEEIAELVEALKTVSRTWNDNVGKYAIRMYDVVHEIVEPLLKKYEK